MTTSEERKTTEALKAAHKATIEERNARDQIKAQALAAITKGFAGDDTLVIVNLEDMTVENLTSDWRVKGGVADKTVEAKGV